jgi:hypothetical protein
MIIPENNTPLDDNENAEEQRSQQDVQSDGIDGAPASEEDTHASDLDNLSQADRASEASYTLNVDKGIAPGHPDKK